MMEKIKKKSLMERNRIRNIMVYEADKQTEAEAEAEVEVEKKKWIMFTDSNSNRDIRTNNENSGRVIHI